MAEATAAPEQGIQHTATVGTSDTTAKDIQAAAKKVGAPDSARITTGGYYQPNVEVDGTQFSVTFTWTE